MNKKLFTAFLLGASLLSTGSFVSCKDYSDEISDLQTQINNANTLHATKAELEKAKSELTDAYQKADATLQTEINALEQAVKNANAAAEKAQSTADAEAVRAKAAEAQAESEIAALTQRVITTESEIAALKAKITELEAADKALQDLIDTKVDASEYKATVEDIYAKIQTCSQECASKLAAAVAELNSKDAELQAAIDAAKAELQAADQVLQTNIENLEKSTTEANEALKAVVAENYKVQQAAIDALDTRIAAIEKDYLTSADKAALQKSIDENKATIKENKDAIAVNAAAIAANYQELKEKIASVQTTLENKISDLQSQIDANKSNISTNTSNIAKNTASIAELVKEVAAVQKEIEAINAEVETLNALILTSLRSLVFIPDSYYWGVEATEINYLEYQAYEVTAADPTKADDVTVMGGTEVRGHEHGGKVTDGTKVLSFAANYHMNPASANLEGATIELLSADKEYVRTATEADALLSITGWSTKDGDLTVNLDAQKPELIKEVPTNKAITVFAVQATLPAAQQNADKDVTVTSDYATLYRSNIKGLVMGYAADRKPAVANTHCPGYEYYKTNSGQTSYACDHLFANEDEALAAAGAAGQYTVDYNSQLPLEGIVETHYTDENGTHMLMTADKLTACGLSYKYELVGASAEATDACATIDADNNVVINKKSESIGKDVVVRVSLVDAEGIVYDYGYIVILVTDKTNNPVLEEPGTPIAYHSQCVTDDYVQSVTTATLWSQLCAGQTIDEAYFAREYDTASATGAQYAKVSDTEWKALDAADYIGEVTYDATKGLVWTIKGDWIRENFYHKNITSATLETYVKLASKNSVSHDVYVHFITTITVDESNGIAFLDADKISNYWYATNANTAGASGYDEIHAQTLSPEDATASSIGYARDLDDTFSDVFTENKIHVNTVNDVTPGKEFNQEAGKLALDLIFSDKNNGKVYKALYNYTTCTYTIKVSDDHKSLLAYQRNGKDITAETVATIEGSDVNTMKVVYKHGTAAEGLLNYARHDELSNDVLAAKIALVAQSTTDCHHVLSLTQNEFDVRFLRPINVITKNLELQDAADSKQIIYLSQLIEDMTDWRNYKFSDHAGYWKYYNIKSIKVLNATSGNSINSSVYTDMNGADITKTTLNKVSDQVMFKGYYEEFDYPNTPSDLTKYGYIEYENLSSTVRTFTIRIPLAVTYEWGTIVTSADVKINSTHEAKKR